jgi:hypothetical protein
VDLFGDAHEQAGIVAHGYRRRLLVLQSETSPMQEVRLNTATRRQRLHNVTVSTVQGLICSRQTN